MKKYDENNIFARILKKTAEASIEHENNSAIVIKDKYPDMPIHNLVLSKNAYIDLRDFLNKATNQEKLDFLDAIKQQLNQFEGGAKVLFNIEESAGQVIFHLHAHILGGY
jgi:histidine triad (HIT) family protein